VYTGAAAGTKGAAGGGAMDGPLGDVEGVVEESLMARGSPAGGGGAVVRTFARESRNQRTSR
jgi:hypothetical protein